MELLEPEYAYSVPRCVCMCVLNPQSNTTMAIPASTSTLLNAQNVGLMLFSASESKTARKQICLDTPNRPIFGLLNILLDQQLQIHTEIAIKYHHETFLIIFSLGKHTKTVWRPQDSQRKQHDYGIPFHEGAAKRRRR